MYDQLDKRLSALEKTVFHGKYKKHIVEQELREIDPIIREAPVIPLYPVAREGQTSPVMGSYAAHGLTLSERKNLNARVAKLRDSLDQFPSI